MCDNLPHFTRYSRCSEFAVYVLCIFHSIPTRTDNCTLHLSGTKRESLLLNWHWFQDAIWCRDLWSLGHIDLYVIPELKYHFMLCMVTVRLYIYTNCRNRLLSGRTAAAEGEWGEEPDGGLVSSGESQRRLGPVCGGGRHPENIALHRECFIRHQHVGEWSVMIY